MEIYKTFKNIYIRISDSNEKLFCCLVNLLYPSYLAIVNWINYLLVLPYLTVTYC